MKTIKIILNFVFIITTFNVIACVFIPAFNVGGLDITKAYFLGSFIAWGSSMIVTSLFDYLNKIAWI